LMEAGLLVGAVLVPSVALCLESDVHRFARSRLFLAVLLGGLASGLIKCWALSCTAALRLAAECSGASRSGEDGDRSGGSDKDGNTSDDCSTRAVADAGNREVPVTEAPVEPQTAKVPDCGVRFRTEATEVEVPSLSALDPEHKARLWWQLEDMFEAQRVRRLLRTLYLKEAGRGAVDTAEDDLWLEQTALAQESCLGLHLGRDQLRLEQRKTYIAAVLAAQAQQLLDTEMAREAGHLSESECRRAEEWAAKQHWACVGTEDDVAFQADASE